MRDNGDPKPLPPQVCKGRGALSNSSGRFEAETREAFDDGWGSLDELPARVPTTLSVDAAKTVLSLEAAREKRRLGGFPWHSSAVKAGGSFLRSSGKARTLAAATTPPTPPTKQILNRFIRTARAFFDLLTQS